MAAKCPMNGTVYVYRVDDSTWRECRVMGIMTGGVNTYTITGPGGPTDYRHSESGVPESKLFTLTAAKAAGYEPTSAVEMSTDNVQIDPAAIDLVALTKDVVSEVNRARTQPKEFAKDIENKVKNKFHDKTYSNGSKSLLVTIEGESTSGYGYERDPLRPNEPSAAESYKTYVDNAIAFLNEQPVLSLLTFDNQLSLGSLDLAKDLDNRPRNPEKPNERMSPHIGGDIGTNFKKHCSYSSFSLVQLDQQAHSRKNLLKSVRWTPSTTGAYCSIDL